jgi:hypothetical protein
VLVVYYLYLFKFGRHAYCNYLNLKYCIMNFACILFFAPFA